MGAAGQTHEDVIESGLPASNVDGLDTGVVKRSHDINDPDSWADGRGDDEAVHVIRRLLFGEGRYGFRGAGEVAGAGDFHIEAIIANASFQFGRGAVGDGSAVVEHDDVVSHAVGFFEVLGGQDDRGAFAHKFAQHLPQVSSAARIEPGRRFIEKQDFGLAHETGRHVKAPAHAPGVGSHQFRGELAQVETLQQNIAPTAGFRFGHAMQTADRLQVQSSGHQAVDGGLLSSHADALAYPTGVGADVDPRYGRRPFRGLTQRGEDTNGGGLAGAVVAEEAQHRARSHIQVEASQRPEIAEPLSEPRGHDTPRERVAGPFERPYGLFVHGTANTTSTLYGVASDFQEKRRTSPASARARQLLVDKAADKINAKFTQQAEKVVAKTAEKVTAKTVKHIETIDRLAARLGALDVWTRSEPVARRPRFTRDAIAAAAMQIADAEGFAAVSMRRIAAHLDAGTMTLYHYVRTKDELLTLIVDAFFGEVVVPSEVPIPEDWRVAMTLIASRTKDALERHPWVLDITDDPRIGPNAMRHFDQSWQALSSMAATFDEKLDVIMAVDEAVFGFCLHRRNEPHHDDAKRDDMVGYIGDLLAQGRYPALAALVADVGLPQVWSRIAGASHDRHRFDRTLGCLLAGFKARVERVN